MIDQPKEALLPEQALKPAWNARWKTVADAMGHHGSPRVKDDCKYFIARGSFRTVQEIPDHYRRINEEAPEVGASKMERSYERKNYGFVVEHRWREKITNVVTLSSFLKGRDEFLDLFIAVYVEALESEFGKDYDISGLKTYVRTEARRFLEEGLLIVFDAASRHRVWRDDGTPDTDLVINLAQEVKRFGLDLFDAKGKVLSDEKEGGRRLEAFARRVVTKHVRNRGGAALTTVEADALIKRVRSGRSEKASDRNDERLKEELEKKFGKQVLAAFVRMVGLYPPTLDFASPGFEFVLRLPGELVETNGVGRQAGQTRWKFDGLELFPDGYEMRARSIDIDREGQKKTLGRVVIDDEAKALDFIKLVGEKGPLVDAARKSRDSGDCKPLREIQPNTFDESLRARKMRKMLLNE